MNVGDRVVYVGRNTAIRTRSLMGKQGTIVRFSTTNDTDVWVRFDDFGDQDYGYGTFVDNIEVIESGPSIIEDWRL